MACSAFSLPSRVALAVALFGALALCGACLGEQGSSAAAPQAAAPREILFGADFEPKMPDSTKALFYESGMNCIRLTGGGYSWAAATHKRQAEDFAARGLKVYLQLGSHYPSADYFKLKSSWLVDSEGATGVEDRKAWSITYSNDHWPQYSYSSEETRRLFEKDFSKYLQSFPKGSNAAGVILHNEPGYFWNDKRLFDYNPATVAKFKAWLEERHGSIEALNRRWGSSYSSFQEIVPPGKPPVKEIGAWMDWRRFNVQLIASFLKWEASFLKSVRPDLRTTTNLDGPMTHWYAYRCADNYEYSAMMDKPGVDIYPTPWTDRSFVSYAMDQLQGVAQGRESHVLECDSFSAKLWKYSEPQRASLLRGELWTLFGHGASGVFIWGFSRGDDFSLTDGEFNERVASCRDIAHMVKMTGIGSFFRPSSEIAVCVDPDSYLYLAGKEAKPNSETPSLDAENHGFHAALSDAGFQSDVIETAQLRALPLSRYKALLLPSAVMMDEELAFKLKEFVASGGLLVADSPFAVCDRWGSPAASAFGLSSLFDSPGSLKRTGKGAALLLPEKAGSSYMWNPGSSTLRRTLNSALSSLAIKPFVELSSSGQPCLLDGSALKDSKGDVLLTVASLGSKGKLPDLAKQVKAKLLLRDAPFKAAFLLPSSFAKDGLSFSGPRPLELTNSEDGVSVELGDVSDAVAVLFAKDSGPLLAASAPLKASPGSVASLSVVCFNPSPKRISGSISLKPLQGVLAQGGGTEVSVEPFSSSAASLKLEIQPDAKRGRAAVSAILSSASLMEGVSSVPVDVFIE